MEAPLKLKHNVVYLCKYKKASYSTVFEITLYQYSPNGKAIKYRRVMGDKFNPTTVIDSWIETDQFWDSYELIDILS